MEELIKLVLNRKLSANQIALQLMEKSSSLPSNEIEKAAELAYRLRPTMPIFGNVLLAVLELREKGEKVDELISLFKRSISSSVDHAIEYLKGTKEIATISFSSQVLMLLEALSPEKVFVSLSNPGGEGRALANELRRRGIDVRLLCDSAICYAAREADVGVVGADALYSDGFLNKIGTRALALFLKEYSKKLIVLSTSFKFDPLRTHKFEYAEEVSGCPLFEFVPIYDNILLSLEDGICKWRYRDPRKFIQSNL